MQQELIEVNCFGVPKEEYKIDKERKILFCGHYPNQPEDHKNYPIVWILHKEGFFAGQWRAYAMIEHTSSCPICNKMMLVRAIAGSTYLACCSDDCYKKYRDVKIKQGGGSYGKGKSAEK